MMGSPVMSCSESIIQSDCSDELDVVHEDLDDSTDGEDLEEKAVHKIWKVCSNLDV